MDVSIIIPTYNRLWCLPKAIESCRNTKCESEIIVVDDGSTDGTWEWLQTQNDLITILQPNQGKCWAANKGYNISKGKYVRFLDSDDYLETTAIDEQFWLAENYNADVVVSGYKVFDDSGILYEQNWIECDDFIAQQLGECDSSHYSAYLFKKTFLSDIPHRPDFAFRDDRMFVIEVALKSPKVAIHEGSAFLHRRHNQNRLQFPNGMKQCVQHFQHLEIYKRAIDSLINRNQLNERRVNACTKILWPLAHWIAKTHINEANEVYKWIIELNPNFLIPEKGFIGFLFNKIGFVNTEKILTARRKLKFGIWS